MALYLYYILLVTYGIALVVSLFYYLSRRAPGGDASVGWALGIFYTAGLAGIIIIALLLRNYPSIGLIVLGFPLVFLAIPKIRRTWTELYTRIPVSAATPPLTLFLENNTKSALHIKLECWFSTSNSNSASLYTTIDYFLEPQEHKNYLLTAHQTRLLAHKSKYVSVVIYERIKEEYEGHTYIKEIQPCMQFYEEKIEAFRSEKYTVVVNPK
ncbi:MAG: hypothetical protein H7246_04750 [Phycisphaerae bacterium]|nr:hypothetical protein [Saprospiraceae bacterium]